VVLSRRVCAGLFVVAVWVAPPTTGTPLNLRADHLPTIPVIAHNLATALSGAQGTLILRVHKHGTNTPRYVTALEWVDLADGRQRRLDFDARGRLERDTARSYPWTKLPPLPSAACRCDLDPFTNFPKPPRISLVGPRTIDGHPTLRLRFVVTEGPLPSTTDMWIDRSTYLPVRGKVAFRATVVSGRHVRQVGPTITTTNDFTWLPRTRANLARLTPGR